MSILKKFVERFTKKKKTVLIDTNIYFSRIVFASEVTIQLFDILDDFEIVITSQIKKELKRTILKKFPTKVEVLDEFFKDFHCTLINTPMNFKDIANMRDDKDIPILAAAIHNNIDYLITGDKDFLVLEVTKPKILTMHKFIETFSEKL